MRDERTHKIMERRRKLRRKRILMAYAARAMVVAVFAVVTTLLVCGCLYLHSAITAEKNAVLAQEADELQRAKAESIAASLAAEASRAAEEAEEAKKKEFEGLQILLDAGHGGNDGGTFEGDVLEKDVTLAVVLKMRKLLEEHGVTVVLTRDYDDFMYLDERVQVANSNPSDLFVSIHCNYYEGEEEVNGLDCYYYEKSEEGKQFAESMVETLKESGALDIRGAKPNNYQVISCTKYLALLIEIGFLSDPTECANLSSEEYQSLMAEELVNAILENFRQ